MAPVQILRRVDIKVIENYEQQAKPRIYTPPLLTTLFLFLRLKHHIQAPIVTRVSEMTDRR